jgi:hypothetical protein
MTSRALRIKAALAVVAGLLVASQAWAGVPTDQLRT